MKLKTEYLAVPIPKRNWDWIAYEEGKEERRHYGYGKTEAEAIADWHEQYDE